MTLDNDCPTANKRFDCYPSGTVILTRTRAGPSSNCVRGFPGTDRGTTRANGRAAWLKQAHSHLREADPV